MPLEFTKYKNNEKSKWDHMTDTPPAPETGAHPTATRKSLQITRRLFHMGMGLFVGVIYQFLISHNKAIYTLGTCACLVYILDQIRINYPELSSKIKIINRYLFRAEEQLKESAGVPFVMGLLLTLISFPKVVALVGIYTLALSDPLSALIGIKYGKTQIAENKSLEGSLAFFTSTLLLAFTVLFWHVNYLSTMTNKVLLTSFLIATITTIFEMLPIRLDDNLTIPIFTSGTLWILCTILNIPL